MKIEFDVKIAWWYKYFYLPGVKITARIIKYFNPDFEINYEKILNTTSKAVKFKKIKRFFND